MLDHVYGADQEMSDTDFVLIFRNFHKCGGSWESLLSGSMDDVRKLEGVIHMAINDKMLLSIATRIASG